MTRATSGPGAVRVTVLVGNPRAASRTRAVGEVVAARLQGWLEDEGIPATSSTTELADHAARLFDPSDEGVARALAGVARSHLLVVASPTYKATYSGMLKAFLDRYGQDGLAGVVAVPVMLGAGPAHALAVEHGLRPLLVELGAACPTRGLYVLESDLPRLADVVDGWFERSLPALAPLAAGLRATR